MSNPLFAQIIHKHVAPVDQTKVAASSHAMVESLMRGAGNAPAHADVLGVETKLASAGVTPLDVAHMAGALNALEEAGFSKKEAAEFLGVTEAAVDDVLTVLASR